jgi:hypothetical protein
VIATHHRSYGLPAAMLRHGIVLAVAAGAVIAQGLFLDVRVDEQLTSWLAVGVGVGLLGAIVSRGLIGLVFAVAGLGIGLMAVLASRLGQTANVNAELANHGIVYIELVEVAALVYVLTLIVLARLRPTR